MASLSRGQDGAAGDLIAGVPRRLAVEVVGHGVDDYRAVDQVAGMEAFVVESAPGVALVSQKRDQISGMIRVKVHSGIVVCSGPGKLPGTIAGLMDMHGIIICRTGHVDIGKAKDLRFHQGSSVRRIIEFYQAADLRGLASAADPGCGLRAILFQDLDKGETRCCFVLHTGFLYKGHLL